MSLKIGGETVLSLRDVSYAYPGSGSPALDGISLELRRGEIVFVTGPTGAGKTTLCLAASGILHHEYGGALEGAIAILGKSVRDYRSMAEIGRHNRGGLRRRRRPAHLLHRRGRGGIGA
jgi:energy-coupling factor transport system ATP-binding protein